MTQPLVEQFATQLRRKQVQGSTDTAEQCLDILYSVIRNHECADGLSLITTIRQVAQQLVQAQPCEFSVANMIRRILYAIRQEFRSNEFNISPLSFPPGILGATMTTSVTGMGINVGVGVGGIGATGARSSSSRRRGDSITTISSSLDSLCLVNPTTISLASGSNPSPNSHSFIVNAGSIMTATSIDINANAPLENHSSSTNTTINTEPVTFESISAGEGKSGTSLETSSGIGIDTNYKLRNNSLGNAEGTSIGFGLGDDEAITTLQEINGLVRRNLGVGALYGASSSASGTANTTESFIFNLIAAERPLAFQPDYTRNVVTLKEQVMEVLRELLAELDSCHPSINEQSFDIVHDGEIILIMGRTRSVELFLKTVYQGDSLRRPRKFKLIIAEGSPEYRGHEMAKIMSEYGIDTTLISDSAIFSFASRANKIIIGCHAVTASGSLIAASGSMMLASAAHYHKIPVIALAGLHKFTPTYPERAESSNLDSAIIAPWMNQLVNPNYVYPYWDGDMMLSGIQPINLHFDMVPSKHVNIIITNIGAMDPHSVHKVITDMYSKEDYIL